MKLTLRSRIYLGILPLLLLFLGIMFFLILDVRSLYRDTQEISFNNLEVDKTLSEIQATLSAMEVLVGEGDDFRARQRDRVTLNRLSVRLGESSEKIEMPSLQRRMAELMFDIGRYDGNLRTIRKLSQKLAEGEGSPRELYAVIEETSEWTIELRESLDQILQTTQTQLEGRAENVYVIVLGGMFVAIALTLAISTVLWLRIIRPIEEMADGMESFGSESDRLSIQYAYDDELGYLARSLEAMTARLKEFQELTNQKLIRSTSAIRSILENSPDAFFILSKDLKLQYSSPIAKRLYAETDLKNEFPGVLREQFEGVIETSEPILSRDLKDAIRMTLHGEEKWFLVHAFPIDAPNPDDLNDSSDSGIQQVAAIFREVTMLKLADRLRQNLLATVSHELKTPITSARMSLYLLLEQQLGSLNEAQVELLETARDDVNRQLAMIEHLLDLSRIEEHADELQVSEFSLTLLVQESLQAHSEISNSYGVTVHFTPPEQPISLHADQAKLRIVLNNFLVNAIKYSGAGEAVEVRTQLTESTCRVEVVDSGPGMDDATVQSIFDAYTRGATSGAIKGTGLGLKISKDIIEAHGGHIGCESQLDVGSRFFFEVPLQPQPA